MSKITMAAAFGAGYVLGSKAGRERYEELRAKAKDVWANPKVQEQIGKASDEAKARVPGLNNDSAEAADTSESTRSANADADSSAAYDQTETELPRG
ncbi:hypothetical protein K0651_05630 [Ornithinimicrobium sp. Arc0846-15]|nr:hypothetical protein [Ornithinimicrobium laminariae]